MDRKFKLFFLASLLITFFNLKMYADVSGSYEMTLHKEKNDGHPVIPVIRDDGGRRIPSRPLYCTIYENGTISGIESELIISYEIWEISNDFCYASFSDGSDFSYFLFNNPGEYKICIVTEEWLYVGYLSTF